MKKFAILLITLFSLSSISVHAQEQQDKELLQNELSKQESKLLYRAKLAEDMKGWRFGADLSYNKIVPSLGEEGVVKYGLHFNAGYRFSRRFYLGAIVGIDMTTPFNIDNSTSFTKEKISRKDKIYVPVMADARFYFNVARVSTFIYGNVGGEFSNNISFTYACGFGLDIHTVKSQCANIKLGIGRGNFETMLINGDLFSDEESKYGLTNGLALNIKIGYSF